MMRTPLSMLGFAIGIAFLALLRKTCNKPVYSWPPEDVTCIAPSHCTRRDTTAVVPIPLVAAYHRLIGLPEGCELI